MSKESLPKDRKSLKNNKDKGEFRRHRTDLSNSIRKGKKAEIVTKRRELTTIDEATPSTSSSNIHACISTLRGKAADETATLQAVREIRLLLSTGKETTPVAEIIESGVLPHIISLLHQSLNDVIVFEATWVLTNIASTDHTSSVLPALPHIVRLLVSHNEYVREQAAWCLSNIAGESAELRDAVLSANAMTYIVHNIGNPANEPLLGTMVWALSNLCRGKPVPDIILVQEAIPCLSSLVQKIVNSSDMTSLTHILLDACWTFSYLSDGDDERIQRIVDTGIIETLVKFLSIPALQTPALRTLSQIVTGNDEQTQAVLDCKVLDKLPAFLEGPNNLKRIACFMLSNIAAGNRKQVHAIFKKPAVLSSLVASIESRDKDVRAEAIWAINNIAASGNDSHVVGMVYFGVIEGLCDSLPLPNTELLILVLDTLSSILAVGKRQEKAWDVILDEVGGLEKIEQLQNHRIEAVYEKAASIIRDYFSGEQEEENVKDENIAPFSKGDCFAFGIRQKLFHD